MRSKKALLFGVPFSFAVASAGANQSNVTISGYLDIGIYRDYDATNKLASIGRSNLAFSGVETLGGGLAATVRLSTRFNVDDGTPETRAFWHDESTVGLKGDFGELKAGRALTAMWNNDWNFDPWQNFDRIASPAWNLWHGASPSDPNSAYGGPVGTVGPAAEYARLNGGVFYRSPTIGGWALNLSQGVSKNPEDRARNSSAVLLYGANAWSGMFSVERNTMKNMDFFVAGKYMRDKLTVMAAYEYEKPDLGMRNRSFTLGGSIFVNGITWNLGYGRQFDYRANFYGLGASRALSKRTNVFVSLGRKSAQFWGAGEPANAYGVGIRHSF